MRVVLLGAGGMLGHDLIACAPEGVELFAYGRDVDVRSTADVSRVVQDARPRWVINAAAYTQVDRAEQEEEVAFDVNARAVDGVARICEGERCDLVHFSTDYVFDGRAAEPYKESDEPNPINAYGRSKLAGERAIARSNVRALVLRTQWLFGRHGRSFPTTMLGRALGGVPTRVVDDQLGRPTNGEDLAAATWRLVLANANGLLHATNSGPVASWYDVAAEIFGAVGTSHLLSRCGSADHPSAATRPAFGALDTRALEARLGAPLPDWRSSLARFVAASLRAARSASPGESAS